MENEKKIYALTFGIDCYEREGLERMSPQERYELASIGKESSVLTLEELSYWVNNDLLQSFYLYFVEI